VIVGFECKTCGFRSSNTKVMRVHGNTVHGLKRVPFETMSRAVKMQTWFRGGRERYWVVGEEGEGKGTGPTKADPQQEGHKGQTTEIGVEGTEGEEPVVVESKEEEAVMANSSKRRARSGTGEGEGGTQRKRVRFAGQVEVGGLDGLKQQLERWSRQCVVCVLAGGRAAEQQVQHTVWECGQEVAEGIRIDSRHMEEGLRAVRAGGGCAGCGVPRVLCERWQWGGRWEESTGRCQYTGVMVSTMIAMATLGRASGRRQVGAWLRQDGLDPQGDEEAVFRWFSKKVWWEGVAAGQAVLVFMMLGRMNGL
jgi:hypothetical protein